VNRMTVAVALLAVLVMASAIAVVEVKHQTRSLFLNLEKLQAERDRLNTEWSRLRLEQGALATHSRVERIAREDFQLEMPAGEDIVLIRSGRPEGDQ